MGRPYSQDLRERVIGAIDDGSNAYEIAPLFNVSVSYIYKILGRRRATGETTARAQRHGPTPKLAPYNEALRTRVRELPDTTIDEVRQWLLSEHEIKVGNTCVWKHLGRLGLTLKKKSQRAAEQDRPDIAQARERWRSNQPSLKPARLVFIDETWASTNMTRQYGRCPRGERLVAPVPYGHWKTTTFVAGLRCDGLTAPFVIDGPMNGEWFLVYVEQVLAPTLSEGDIVIMDNLSSHKVAGVREAIEVKGARLLYLPAYSPDLNPIEQFFAKLKSLLRKAAARSIDTLWRVIGRIVRRIPSQECANYFANLGYV
jgi:transposase